MSVAPGIGVIAIGYPVEKCQDIIRRNLIDVRFAKFQAESINCGLIQSDSIFFSNAIDDNRSKFRPLLLLSWFTSMFNWVD